jgi:hypothetical protein
MPLQRQYLSIPSKPDKSEDVLYIERQYGVELEPHFDAEIQDYIDEWVVMYNGEPIGLFAVGPNGAIIIHFPAHQIGMLLEKRRRVVGSLWN